MKNLRCKDCQSLKIRIEIKTTAKGTKIAKCECEMCGCMFLKTILSGRKSESDRETGSRRLKHSIAVERLRNSVNKNIEIDYSFKFKTVVTKKYRLHLYGLWQKMGFKLCESNWWIWLFAMLRKHEIDKRRSDQKSEATGK